MLIDTHGLDMLMTSLLEEAIDAMHEADAIYFLDGLEPLLEETSFRNKDAAAKWYWGEWVRRVQAYKENLETDRKHNQFWNHVSFLLVMGSLYLFIGLMSFIAFPLVIRIERNTRQHPSAP